MEGRLWSGFPTLLSTSVSSPAVLHFAMERVRLVGMVVSWDLAKKLAMSFS